MGSGWTGKAGEPVPAMLRHRRATDPTRGAPDGRCACGLPLASGERVRPTDLCPVAVAQRLAELEAHEASIHKAVARSRRGIVRWLWAASAEALAMAPRGRRRSALRDHSVSLAGAADAIAHGDDTAWCEANPETSPAPVGADAGRDPGSSEE